jgi:hypothetical protein
VLKKLTEANTNQEVQIDPSTIVLIKRLKAQSYKLNIGKSFLLELPDRTYIETKTTQVTVLETPAEIMM